MSEPKPVILDVFSDIACPWCFIGKRRLAEAVAAGGGPVEVRWHAYQLMPDLPPEGVEAAPFFEKKFGGKARVEALFQRVADVGREAGIPFDFQGQKRAPNTRLGHRVVQLAQKQGKGNEAKEAMLAGHFVEGADISNVDVVLGLLEKHHVGLDLVQLRQELADGAGNEEVDADIAAARRIGVTGVPFFIANGAVAMSGAQDVPTFLSFLADARNRTADA